MNNDEPFGDLQGPLLLSSLPHPSWLLPTARPRRLRSVRPLSSQAPEMFGDLLGPLAYWGPSARTDLAQQELLAAS